MNAVVTDPSSAPDPSWAERLALSARPRPCRRRPAPWEEAAASRMFLALSPRMPRKEQWQPPDGLEPFTHLEIPRRRRGRLSATWYPVAGAPRGAVLLVHPWVARGKAYFHRRGRIPALRRAGYHVLTFDLPGFGSSGPAAGFFDRDVADALDFLRAHAPAMPLHLWGISAGGYWAHLALSHSQRVQGAMFEDVSPHLFEWSHRMMPSARAAYAVFRRLFPRAYAYLDLRAHAPALKVRCTAYVSGERDPGLPPADTLMLAELTGGRSLLVPDAEHLESIRTAHDEVVALGLETFARAEDERAA